MGNQSPVGLDFEKYGILRRENPRLHQPCRPAIFPEDAVEVQRVCKRLGKVIEEIKQLYPFSRGCGVAAPQIGELIQITGVIMPEDDEPRFFVNPRIIACSERKILDYEGCLSFWEFRGRVLRPESLTVEYNEPSGLVRTLDMTGILARLICHEIDHLNGILYEDHLREPEQLIGLKAYQAMREASKLPLPEYS